MKLLVNKFILILVLFNFTAYSQVMYDTLMESKERNIYEVTKYVAGIKIDKKRFINDTMILDRIFSKDDSLNYEILSYFKDGKLRGRDKWINDMAEGDRYEVYESGEYQTKGFCFRDTCYDTTYQTNGIISSIQYSVLGKIIYTINYCESGSVEFIMIDDSANYKFIQYHCETNNPFVIGTYDHGVNIGKWKIYDNSGNICKIEFYTKKVLPRGESNPVPVLLKTKEYQHKKLFRITYYGSEGEEKKVKYFNTK